MIPHHAVCVRGQNILDGQQNMSNRKVAGYQRAI